MPTAHWSEHSTISIPLLIDQAALVFICNSVIAITGEKLSLALSFSHGETLTYSAVEEIEEITDDQLARAVAIEISGYSDEATVSVRFAEATYQPADVGVSSNTRNPVLQAKDLATEIERRFPSPATGGAFVTARPPLALPAPLDTPGNAPKQTENEQEARVIAIREVPKLLPYGKLYVDDLEEIAKILIVAATSERRPNPQVTLISKTHVFPSFATMMQHGGETHEFKVSIDTYISLSIYDVLRPELSLTGISGDTAWATYSKIKAICDSRSYRLKNAVIGLPAWVKWCLCAGWFAIPSPFRGTSTKMHVAGVAGLLTVAILFTFELFRRNTVVFARYRPHSRGISERQRMYVQNFLFALLGAVLSVLLQVAYDHATR